MRDMRYASGRFIRVHYNAGTRTTRTEATLPGFGTIWFYGRCIANILYLSKVKYKLCVMYNSEEFNQFIMVIPNKGVLFSTNQNGIY